MAEKIVREWIVSILKERLDILRIAILQRAKFEGWLKFELAAHIEEQQDIKNVKVEENSFEKGDGHSRSDIAFDLDGIRYYVELKTLSANWKVLNVPKKTQSTTGNIAAIVNDAEILRSCKGQGIIAFVTFPVRSDVDDREWEEHLKRIASRLRLPLSVQGHTSRISVQIGDGYTADVIVCCFDVPKTALSSYAAANLEAIVLEAQEQLILHLQ